MPTKPNLVSNLCLYEGKDKMAVEEMITHYLAIHSPKQDVQSNA